MIRLTESRRDRTAITKFGRRFVAAEKRAAHLAVDKATKAAHKRMRNKMKGVGLGKLGNAVGSNTSLSKGKQGATFAWGAIFAKRGDESRAGGALDAYSNGANIRPKGDGWLWIQTNAIPRRVAAGGARPKRTTPELYNRSSLATTIGKLHFRKIGPSRALLVIRRVSVSPKTGRAKALAKGKKTRTRIAMKEVVAFIGIKYTKRAKRFDKDEIMAWANKHVPALYSGALQRLLAEGR